MDEKHEILSVYILIIKINNEHQFTFQSFIEFDYIQIKMTQQYNKWNDYEDNTLIQLVKRYGTKKWNIISKEMKSCYQIFKRNGKQCRQRWVNQLNPENLNKKWATEDHLKLILIQRSLGTKWVEISRHFPGRYFYLYCRTDNNIKNQFYSIIKKAIRKMCRYVSIRTTSMNIYTLKPTTLSQIFAQGDCNTQFNDEIPQFQNLRRNTLYKREYREIKKVINSFIFSNIHDSSLLGQPSKCQVLEVLNQLMKINSSFYKDLSFSANTPESYSDCEKKQQTYFKSQFSIMKSQQNDDEMLELLKYKNQHWRGLDQQSISQGIFSPNTPKNIFSIENENKICCTIYKKVEQLNSINKIQTNDSFYCFGNGKNTALDYSGYFELNFSQEIITGPIRYLPPIQIFSNTKIHQIEDDYEKYLQ